MKKNAHADDVQLDMFITNKRGIYNRFLDFHIKYPTVYRLFEKFAIQLIEHGHTKLGAKMIIERIRWEYATDSKDEHGFKINNDFTAHYARWFIKLHPEYKNYFEFREIKTI